MVGQKWDDNLGFHGPEAAYLIDGYNGRLADAREPGALLIAIKEVVERNREMGKQARAYFDEHLDISRMVEGFGHAIDYALPPGIGDVASQSSNSVSADVA